MVMEAVDAVPTPDVVGREFVRQYYTLLNQAPAHAHRFYNSNSYFVHGAMSKPAIGQRQIHQKIQQLNFRDCHAKISQVDSQATLGNGLVVQVSGELSNDGEPMRRFTQTFVLGTQSPKKYYVHNDIFRYQDMLLSDEEGDSPSEEDAEQPQDTQPDNPTTTNLEYFSSGTPSQVETPLAPASVPGQNVSLNGTAIHDEGMQAGQTPLPPPQESNAPPVINGRVMPEELRIMGEEFIIGNQPNVQPELKSPKENKINRTAPNKPVEPEETGPTEHSTTQNENEPFPTEIIQEQLHISETSTNEPKTYANLLKSDPLRMSSGVTTSGSSTSGNRPITNYNPQSTPAQRPDDALQPPRPQRNQMRGVPSRGNNRGERTGGPLRSSFNEDGGLSSGGGSGENQDRRRNQPQYADSHQLFMGNLPLEASENDLREIFSKYGTIIDLRIHSKASPGAKGPPGSRVPNYGFITFENPQSVQEVLNDKPICFPKEGGVKLNVEEKKTKLRSSLPSQGGGNGSSSGGGGGGGGGGSSGGSESNWSSGRAPPRGGPSSRPPRGGGARGNFNRDSRGPPVNQRSNFTPRR